MTIVVVPYDDDWPRQYERVAADLRRALGPLPHLGIEHVGSTSVPGLAAKPVVDVDVVVTPEQATAAVAALVAVGYVDEGERGVPGRTSMRAPDRDPHRHVYVCVDGSLALRNHLAVRDRLRVDDELRDEYAAVKRALAAAPGMDSDTYVAGKSDLLQRVLARAGLTAAELAAVRAANEPDA